MSSNPFPVDDTSINAIVDLMSDTGVDSIWLDLDGDQVPETMVQVDGPFSTDVEMPDLDDATLTGDDIVGEPIATLLPWESDTGTADVWALPSDDWTNMDCYDPMAVPGDWTVDGGSESGDGYDIPIDGTGAPFTVDDPGGFSDTSGYYDSSGYTDTTGYFDSSGYFDPSAGGYDATGDSWDTWDGSDTTSIYDGAYSDPSGYLDTTAYDGGSSYDAGAGYDDGGGGGAFDANTYDSTGYEDPTVTTEVSTEVSDDWDAGIATEQSQPWTDYSSDMSDTSWDLYDQSMDAWESGDTQASYDLNSMSQDAWSDSTDAWNYSTEVYNDPTGWTETSTYETTYDTGATTSYDTSYDSTSYTYDSASTDTGSYDSSSDW